MNKFRVGDVICANTMKGKITAQIIRRDDTTVTYLEKIIRNGIVSEKQKTKNILLKTRWHDDVCEQAEALIAWAKHVLVDGEYEEFLSYYYPPTKL